MVGPVAKTEARPVRAFLRVDNRDMLLTLHIIKIESGDYRANVMEGTQHLGNYEATSIRECILLAAENPLPDLAGFHLWYEHVCAGTVSAGEMREDAEALAERLANMYGAFRM